MASRNGVRSLGINDDGRNPDAPVVITPGEFILGEQNTFKVVTDKSTYNVPAVGDWSWRGQNNEETFNKYSYRVDGEVGLIEFNEMSDLNEFKNFLSKAFVDFRQKEVKTLVVDLRQNSGGDSRLGDALISHITNKKYKQVDYMEVKSSKSQKRFFYKNYFKWFVYPAIPIFKLTKVGRATLGKPGKKYQITFKEKSAAKSGPMFTGDVYFLTSNYTFSSAVLLVNAIQCYQIGKVVGEETGGRTITYGDIITVAAPHSKIKADSPSKILCYPVLRPTVGLSQT